MSEPTTKSNPFAWNELDAKDAAILQSQSEPGMWLRPSIVRAMRGNCGRAVLLCQLLFWSNESADEEGWFDYTVREIIRRTGMQRLTIRKHRDALAAMNLIEFVDQPTPLPHRFRVNLPAVVELILKHVNMTRQRAKSKGYTGSPSKGYTGSPSKGYTGSPSKGYTGSPLSYSKNIEESTKASATEKQTHKKAGSKRGASLPVCRIETSILCPTDLSLTPALEAWAGKRLPPATLARVPGLIEYFVRDQREVQQTRLRDRKAWEARFQNFLQSCGERDTQRQGSLSGGSGAGKGDDYSPSYDDLAAAGIVPALPASPSPTATASAVAPPFVYVPGDKCSF